MHTGEKGKKKLNTFIIIVLAILVLLAAFFVVGNSMATAEVVLNDGENVTVEYGSTWSDPGAGGVYRFPLLSFMSGERHLNISGDVDTGTLGEQAVHYSFDYLGKHGEATRHVTVVDTTGPEISLKTNPNYYTKPNEEYEEEGFTAIDLHDGDVTSSVVRTVTKDKIIYTATDSFGNTTTVERKIPFDDRVAPEILLDGGEEISVRTYSTYYDSFTATDDVDGDITDKVSVKGSVDTKSPGDYTLTYEVSDKHGNKATAKRLVHVVSGGASGSGDGGYVYLTFDDGPYKYTERLLNLLDKYGVKATFFVTAWYGYPEMIGEEFRRGHSVGVHTYYHRYDEIYSSDEAFWADFELVQDLIVSQTGQRTSIMRFPGGSSNGISAQYNQGIMTRLTQQAEARGYTYFDWNVSSGDADGLTDPWEIAQNTIDQISERTTSIVLCHDVKEYTIDAIEEIIRYCLQNGYELLPLTPDSPTMHHTINN